MWTALVVLLLAVPILLALLYFHVSAYVFQLLGLSPLGALLVLGGSLIGGLINIPLTRRRIELAPDPALERLSPLARWLLPFVHYYPPPVVEQVLALNVGGAVVPVVFSAYLLALTTTPWVAAVIATAAVTLVAKLLARAVPGAGITLPTFIPPLVSALTARGLVGLLGLPVMSAAPVAYIAGTLGTLIGADLLNLPRVLRGTLIDEEEVSLTSQQDWFGPPWPSRRNRRYMVSIGGAGVFDGIFLSGIVAPLLAVL